MQVDDPNPGLRQRLEKRRREHVHEPETDHQFGPVRQDEGGQVTIVRLTRGLDTLARGRMLLLVAEEVVVGSRDGGAAGALKPVGILAVRQDTDDSRGNGLHSYCIEECLQIRAAAGDEYGEAG